MRVDPNLFSLVGAGIASTAQNVQTSIAQLSSGLRVNLPSDDPAAAATNLRSVAASAAVDRYTTNSDAVLVHNQMADSILSNVVQTLTQAVGLGTEGANGSLTQQDRSAAATQVQALLQQVVMDANTKYNGSSLFSGTSTTADAFVADSTSPSGYTYQGSSQSGQAAIGVGVQVSTGIAGDQVFTSSNADVLGALSQLANGLNTGTRSQIAAATLAVSTALQHISQQRVIYSGVTNQIDSQESYLSQEKVSLSSQQQQLTGVDMTSVIEQLTQAQTAHSAMLAAAGKVLSTSLLNYFNPAG
jgi:flagellar hook-associated protein 3 FlgL